MVGAKRAETAEGRGPADPSGQTLVEYLLMSLMLLFLFTGLYRLLQGQLKTTFERAGRAILAVYD